MPRKAALGEFRNDHQRAIVSQLPDRIGIYPAETEACNPGPPTVQAVAPLTFLDPGLRYAAPG